MAQQHVAHVGHLAFVHKATLSRRISLIQPHLIFWPKINKESLVKYSNTTTHKLGSFSPTEFCTVTALALTRANC
jgi:hypothetical protein